MWQRQLPLLCFGSVHNLHKGMLLLAVTAMKCLRERAIFYTSHVHSHMQNGHLVVGKCAVALHGTCLGFAILPARCKPTGMQACLLLYLHSSGSFQSSLACPFAESCSPTFTSNCATLRWGTTLRYMNQSRRTVLEHDDMEGLDRE